MALTVHIEKQLSTMRLDVTFTAPNGVTAILGASGSGKSMTLSCIAGLERPDRGRIVIDGQPVFDSETQRHLPARARRVGMLFQSYALFPNMTVLENICCGMQGNRRAREAQAAVWMERFHLSELAHQKPLTLSGGQAQRVALARMLGAAPRTILLDEPFSALDATLKWQLEEGLREVLASFDGSVILVTHDRDEAYRMADQIVVLDQGQVVFCGSKTDFMQNPCTVAAAKLSGCKNIAPAQFTAHGIAVPDWQLFLEGMPVPSEPAGHIGLRAHYLRPATDTEVGGVFEARLERYTESPFSWLIYLRLYHDGSPAKRVIYWILDKQNTTPLTGGRQQKAWLESHVGQSLRMSMQEDGILYLQ